MFKTFNGKEIKAVLAIGLIGVMFLCFTACGPESAKKANVAKKAKNVESLMTKQPNPTIENSMDRFLLAERLVRFNDPGKMSYLYIFEPAGRCFQFTIIGKVASTSKRLTQPIDYNGLLEPDEMGVYGHSSGNAKVGMTTLGSLIEYGGFAFYIYSETPLSFKGLKDQIIEIKVEATQADIAALKDRLGRAKKMK